MKEWTSFLALAILTLSLAPACTTDLAGDSELAGEPDDSVAASDLGQDELAAGLPVVLDGVEYSAAEIARLGVGPLHYVSTYESVRDGYVFAFTTRGASDDFRASYPVAALRQEKTDEKALFARTHSKFFDLTGYSQKFFELGSGESAINLATHPCNCDQDISSLKASETATWTRVYDLVNFGGDSWSIPSGAEISDLSVYTHNGASWNQDISSIQIID